MNQGKADANCYLCAAAGRLAQKTKSAHQKCRAILFLPAHLGVTVNLKFQSAAMLLKIVWACMKGIIKTENRWEVELRLHL